MECKGVLMGCTGPREPGWDHTWPAVDRVGSRRWAPLTTTLTRGGRRGRRVWRTRGTLFAAATDCRMVRTSSGERMSSTGRGPGQLAGRSGKELVLRSCQRGVGGFPLILGLRCKEELSPGREQCEPISRGWHSTQMGCGLSLRSGQPGEWRGVRSSAPLDLSSLRGRRARVVGWGVLTHAFAQTLAWPHVSWRGAPSPRCGVSTACRACLGPCPPSCQDACASNARGLAIHARILWILLLRRRLVCYPA